MFKILKNLLFNINTEAASFGRVPLLVVKQQSRKRSPLTKCNTTGSTNETEQNVDNNQIQTIQYQDQDQLCTRRLPR